MLTRRRATAIVAPILLAAPLCRATDHAEDGPNARAHDHVVLLAGISPGLPFLASASVLVGLPLQRDFLLEADAVTSGTIGGYSNTAGLHGRWYFGDAGSVRMGIRGGRIYIDCGEHFPNPDCGAEEVVGIDHAAGARWRWGAFTLGVDWYGIFVPFAHVGGAMKRQVGLPELRLLDTRLGLSF